MSLYYNIIKEADLEFVGEPFPSSNGYYFLRVENKERGKAEQCMGHLTVLDDKGKEILPPSNRSVWRLGLDDYVLHQNIGYQDDLLLFQVSNPTGTELIVSFPSAYTGEMRKRMGARYALMNFNYQEAKNYKLVIKLEATTGHMPKQKEIPIGTL